MKGTIYEGVEGLIHSSIQAKPPTLEEVKWRYTCQILKSNRGDRRRTALQLGIGIRTLQRLLKKHNWEDERYSYLTGKTDWRYIKEERAIVNRHLQTLNIQINQLKEAD